MRVLGVDPSFTGTGVVALEFSGATFSFIDRQRIASDPTQPLPYRWAEISNRVEEILTKVEPTMVAMESVALESTMSPMLSMLNSIVAHTILNHTSVSTLFMITPMQLKSWALDLTTKDQRKAAKGSKTLIVKTFLSLWGEKLGIKKVSSDIADAYFLAEIAGYAGSYVSPQDGSVRSEDNVFKLSPKRHHVLLSRDKNNRGQPKGILLRKDHTIVAQTYKKTLRLFLGE